MKIACQSCQAKYTIADEKVVGKVVKIRCKKCGATIVVNGQDGGQAGVAAEEPTEVRGSSADLAGQAGDAEGWTVNVGDNDQRTLTTPQVVAEFHGGVITDETYCWRDGMGDWLPLREIEELSSACGLTAAAAFAKQPQAAAAPRGSSTAQAAAGSGNALAGIFGSSPPGAAVGGMTAQSAASGGAAAARRAGGRAGGADLFGGAAEAGGENDVMTSAPNSSAARGAVDDSKMTGQRNENSVLFSLNALTASEPKKGGNDKMTGAAEGDGSGLIDIRALSSSMAGSGGAKKSNHADDIMNLGGGGAFSAALAAPVLTAPLLDSADPNAPVTAASSNMKMLVGFGAITVLLLCGMVGMYFALKPGPVPVATTGPESSAGTAAPASPGTAASTAQTAAAPTATASAPEAVADNTPKAVPPSVGAGRRPSGGGGGGGGGGSTFVAPPPPAPVAQNGGGGGGGGSLAEQMAKAVPHPDPAANATSGGGGGGSANPFDRGAAAAALGSIADGVTSCKKPGGPTGDGHVSITFSPGGSVVSAIVDQPPFAGTAVGGCVAGKFRGAHVPAFAGGNLTIGKRFSIN